MRDIFVELELKEHLECKTSKNSQTTNLKVAQSELELIWVVHSTEKIELIARIVALQNVFAEKDAELVTTRADHKVERITFLTKINSLQANLTREYAVNVEAARRLTYFLSLILPPLPTLRAQGFFFLFHLLVFVGLTTYYHVLVVS